ncbi:MAG: hypothetical protein LBR25_02515 [Erysipelotrichaceae bacterium]|jgi:hypothetical protein|nr:hypothetical protein [Erysipelotrichaceae bacterium]
MKRTLLIVLAGFLLCSCQKPKQSFSQTLNESEPQASNVMVTLECVAQEERNLYTLTIIGSEAGLSRIIATLTEEKAYLQADESNLDEIIDNLTRVVEDKYPGAPAIVEDYDEEHVIVIFDFLADSTDNPAGELFLGSYANQNLALKPISQIETEIEEITFRVPYECAIQESN